jgi:CheY-like chemotaxis protein
MQREGLSTGTRGTRPRLLAIEDQAIVQEMLTTGLGARGYEVAIAPDAGVALDLLRHQPATAILLDTSMRLDESWAFASAFRHVCSGTTGGQCTPVIAFSASDETADRAAELDVDDVLPQALTEPQAIDALAALVTQHIPTQPLRRARRVADGVRPFGLFGLTVYWLRYAAGGVARSWNGFSRAGAVGNAGSAGRLAPHHA